MIITGEIQTSLFQMKSQLSALGIEVAFPEMRNSKGSVMNQIKKQHGIKGGTKKIIFKAFEKHIENVYNDAGLEYIQSKTTKKVLEKIG